ncbi:MAG: hypothetical protein M1828_002250 [Chrysothrix sp. TS-e1954]|nr:MAG: hypothetical protein M1828_002250 [Chrysothrix sp. TS-e1954]
MTRKASTDKAAVRCTKIILHCASLKKTARKRSERKKAALDKIDRCLDYLVKMDQRIDSLKDKKNFRQEWCQKATYFFNTPMMKRYEEEKGTL